MTMNSNTPKSQFCEPRFSEIFDIMNKRHFHILLFIQTQFSDQKRSEVGKYIPKFYGKEVGVISLLNVNFLSHLKKLCSNF